MFIREQLGTRTGKGLASALSVTASARKVQNRDKEKQKLEAGKWIGDFFGGLIIQGSGRMVVIYVILPQLST